MKKLFSKRHFEWLAHFAGANLSVSSARHLAEALVDTNDNYDMQKFLQTYHRIRNFTRVQEHVSAVEVRMAGDAGQPMSTILPWREDGGVMVPVEPPTGDMPLLDKSKWTGADSETPASQLDDFIDLQPAAEDAFDAYLRRHKQEAIEAGVDAIFQHHKCWKCDSGRKPCLSDSSGSGPRGCRYLYAVND